jgi:hypothetical protein
MCSSLEWDVQYLGNLFNDIILKIIWPHILKVVPWKDQFELLQNMHFYNIDWEKFLVHNNGEWFHGKFCYLVSHFEKWDKHVKEQIKKEHIGQKCKLKIHLGKIYKK